MRDKATSIEDCRGKTPYIHPAQLFVAPWQSVLIVTMCLVHLLLCAPLHNRHVKLLFLKPYPIYTNLPLGSWAIALTVKLGCVPTRQRLGPRETFEGWTGSGGTSDVLKSTASEDFS